MRSLVLSESDNACVVITLFKNMYISSASPYMNLYICDVVHTSIFTLANVFPSMNSYRATVFISQ